MASQPLQVVVRHLRRLTGQREILDSDQELLHAFAGGAMKRRLQRSCGVMGPWFMTYAGGCWPRTRMPMMRCRQSS
jgi:hypothetical protein